MQAETARKAAETEQAKTQASLDVAETEVAQTNEELKAANGKLRGALDTAKASQHKAEVAGEKAQKAAADLGVALGRERARVKQLEDERKKLMTKLQ